MEDVTKLIKNKNKSSWLNEITFSYKEIKKITININYITLQSMGLSKTNVLAYIFNQNIFFFNIFCVSRPCFDLPIKA